ncbi:MAG: hypothetical protein ABSC37_04730 [Xanthobacteraceae bacterium]|jgi:hypothetical protein
MNSFSRRTSARHFVTAGLDPVVHAEVRQTKSSGNASEPSVGMDCRVEARPTQKIILATRPRPSFV